MKKKIKKINIFLIILKTYIYNIYIIETNDCLFTNLNIAEILAAT